MVIGRQGYQEFEQAYFPLYPLLINVVAPVFSNVNSQHFLAGLLISNVALLIGLYLWQQLVNHIYPKTKMVLWTMLFLLSFPTSFYFGLVYTESVFLIGVVGFLLFIARKKWAPAVVFGYIAALTRLVGIFLILPLLGYLFVEKMQALRKDSEPLSWKLIQKSAIETFLSIIKQPLVLLAVLSPLLGFATYSLYLYITYGDPLLFFNVQPVFGANRSTELVILPQVLFRYVKIFITAAWNYQYLVAVIEFALFSLVCGILAWDVWHIWRNKWKKDAPMRFGINLFSWSNMILPTLTGTLTSTPRYALMAISIYFILAQIKRTWIKIVIFVLFALLHIALMGLFIQGYFVA